MLVTQWVATLTLGGAYLHVADAQNSLPGYALLNRAIRLKARNTNLMT